MIGTTTVKLAGELDGSDPPDAELVAWLATSPRFRAFAVANRDKIRKKLRGAVDAGARGDVRVELDVIRLLLGDKKVSLAFEPYGSGHVGPDLGVSVGSSTFMLEVTRRRGAPPDAATLALLILAKLRQFRPSIANALLIAVDADSAAAVDVTAAIRLLRARADAKDEAFFASRSAEIARGFYDRFLRLAGVIVWSERSAASPRAVLWTNASARIAPPAKAARVTTAALAMPG